MVQTSYQYANAVISDDYKNLQGIHLQYKNIAIYERDIYFLKSELNLLAQQAIECRASGTIEEILSVLKAYFDNNLSECPSVLKDISEVLGLFNRTTQASSFRLLFSKVNTNMCRKFHTDINNLRLLCTYAGPGTLWVPDEAIDDRALRRNGKNHEIVRDEQQIQQVQTGDVAILKGALYPDAQPILHRSPTIEETGETRILLRIDTNEPLNFLI
ncbi:MAG: hypothetical protein ACI9XO_001048 [Paraglaciecola sp.]|jgi:hypothetical protein